MLGFLFLILFIFGVFFVILMTEEISNIHFCIIQAKVLSLSSGEINRIEGSASLKENIIKQLGTGGGMVSAVLSVGV